MEYISRIVDDVIDRKTEAFNAVSITKDVERQEQQENDVKLLLNFRMKTRERGILQ